MDGSYSVKFSRVTSKIDFSVTTELDSLNQATLSKTNTFPKVDNYFFHIVLTVRHSKKRRRKKKKANSESTLH